jgi:hypothetical protein
MSVSVDPHPTRATPLWRRLLAGAAVLAAVAAAMLVAGWVTASRTGASRLQAILDHLDKTDPNWRLHEIEAAREVIPEAENSARLVVAVVKALPRAWPSAAVGKLLEESDPPPARFSRERLDLLRADLAPVEPILAEARRLAGMPRGRHRLEITENPFYTRLEDQQRTRSVALLLALDAIHRAHRGEIDPAVASCRASLNAARSLGDEPLVISMHIRITGWKSAGEAVERVLSLGAAGDAELAKLAALLAEEEKHPTLYLALRGERGSVHAVMTGLGEGRFSLADPILDLGEMMVWRERLAGWQLRMQVRREHPEVLEMLNRDVAAAALPAHEQAKPMEDIDREVRSHKDHNTSLTIPILVLGVTNVAERFRQGQALLRTLRAAVAAERYRLAKGAWPASLGDLVPAYLDAVPLDPIDGAPLRYARHAEGVTVYSVGLDGTDDGGRIDRKTSRVRGADVGYQLWDVKHRGRPVAGKK